MSAARSCAARVAVIALLAAPSAWAQWLAGPEVDPCPTVGGGAWSHANAVAAASDGRSWFVAWQDARASADFDAVYGARVAPDGSVLEPIGIPIARTSGRAGAPAVAFDGEHFVAAWFQTEAAGSHDVDAVAARVASDGTLLDPAPIVLARALGTNYDRIRAVRDARGVLVAWWDASHGQHAPLLYGEHLAPDGTLVEPAPVALVTGPTCQGQFDLAFDGAHTLLA